MKTSEDYDKMYMSLVDWIESEYPCTQIVGIHNKLQSIIIKRGSHHFQVARSMLYDSFEMLCWYFDIDGNEYNASSTISLEGSSAKDTIKMYYDSVDDEDEEFYTQLYYKTIFKTLLDFKMGQGF